MKIFEFFKDLFYFIIVLLYTGWQQPELQIYFINIFNMSNKKAIGIDLGSTMSEVCVMESGRPAIVLTAEGSKTFPSVVNIDDNGERKVGASAKRQMLMKPKQTINLIKRLIGRNWEEAQDAIKHLHYDVVNHNGYPYVKINDKEYSPQEISSWILQELKKQADEYLGHSVEDAVITVPALFDDSQRNATKEAGELAGLNVLRIINEPTAACLASKLEKSGKYAVVDFGGSTTDVTVLDYDKEMQLVEVLSSYGDTWLGGADIDNAVAQWIIDEFKKQENFDLSKDPMAMQRVVEAAEKAKIELSGVTETEINLPYITAVDGVPKHFVKKLNKANFENIASKYVDKVIKCAEDARAKADCTLDGIILVGGSCRIPLLQKRLTDKFGVELIHKADLDLAVAEGAAIQANKLVGNTSDEDITLLDVTPISLGIEVNGSQMGKLIDANTTIPTRKSQVFTTAVDNQPAVSIIVLQGERPMSRDNKIIGQFNLDGIAPAPRGVPQIEVTFEMDANGILTVTAKDLGTQKEQHITIEKGNSLSKEEIERIKKDAADHAEEDKKKKEEIDKLNTAEGYKYAVEASLKDEHMGSKFTDEEKEKINELLKELDEQLQTKDLEKIEPARKALEDYYQPIIMRIYQESAPKQDAQQAQGNPFAQMGGDNPFKDAEVVDAEEVK